MRNFVRSGWVSTILVVLSWILLLLIAFFYIRALMKESMWFDKGNTPIVELPDKRGYRQLRGELADKPTLRELRVRGDVLFRFVPSSITKSAPCCECPLEGHPFDQCSRCRE